MSDERLPELRRAATERPSATAGDVARSSLLDSAIRLLAHEPGVRLGEDPEAVHQARVATRRLRSDLRTYGRLLDPERTQRLRDELRWLGRSLGAVRDAEVLAARLRRRAAGLAQADAADALELVDRVFERREEARAALLSSIGGRRYATLVTAVVEGALAPPFLGDAVLPAEAVLPRLMDARWKRLRRTMRSLDSRSTNEALHGARIKTKRVRYAAESMIPTFGKPARRFAAAAEALQDMLGEHQDAVAAEEWLRESAEGSKAGVAFAAGELALLELHEQARARRAWPAAWRSLRRKGIRFWV